MVKFACKICSRIQLGTQKPRFAGICCNACATFFNRALYAEQIYTCYNKNECLKVPSLWGACCRKCRFVKCMSVGMPITKVLLPFVLISYHDAIFYAQTIDSLLVNAITNPDLLKLYLTKQDEALFAFSFQTFNQSIAQPLTQRVMLLTNLIEKHPINSEEGLPTLCLICVCRIKFPWLAADEQKPMLQTQCDAFQKLEKEKLNVSYLYHLIELGKECLNIFNSFICVK